MVTTVLSFFVSFFVDLPDRDLTAYLIHSHPGIFPFMKNQLARRADKENLTDNHIWSETRESD